MDTKDLVGQAATICTIAVFLSGIQICQKVWRNKSTKDISPMPFLCGLVSCSFWLRYGLLINDTALIVVNTAGALLQASYTCWYFHFNVQEGFKTKLLIFLLIIVVFYVFTTFIAVERAQVISGISACTASVIFMGSPLSSVASVIRNKSVESLPFPLILSTFVMGSLWFYYGILTNDSFVQVPNFLGAVLAFIQLCLFLMYPSKKTYSVLPVHA